MTTPVRARPTPHVSTRLSPEHAPPSLHRRATRVHRPARNAHGVALPVPRARADFVSAEELAAQWRIFTPVLKELVARKVEPAQYAYGSRGPAAADKLARRYGMTKFGGGLTPYVFVGDLLAGNTVDEHLNGGGPPTASRHSSHRVEPS